MCKVSSNTTYPYHLSWMRIMWMLVLFDLPVSDTKGRKSATKFRNDLLDKGFLMAQFSVYYKLAGTREHADRLSHEIQKLVPQRGSVNILIITDKQYANMICIVGKKKKKTPVMEQLMLF